MANNENLIQILSLIRNELDELLSLIQENKICTDGSSLKRIKLEAATIMFHE